MNSEYIRRAAKIINKGDGYYTAIRYALTVDDYTKYYNDILKDYKYMRLLYHDMNSKDMWEMADDMLVIVQHIMYHFDKRYFEHIFESNKLHTLLDKLLNYVPYYLNKEQIYLLRSTYKNFSNIIVSELDKYKNNKLPNEILDYLNQDTEFMCPSI